MTNLVLPQKWLPIHEAYSQEASLPLFSICKCIHSFPCYKGLPIRFNDSCESCRAMAHCSNNFSGFIKVTNQLKKELIIRQVIHRSMITRQENSIKVINRYSIDKNCVFKVLCGFQNFAWSLIILAVRIDWTLASERACYYNFLALFNKF